MALLVVPEDSFPVVPVGEVPVPAVDNNTEGGRTIVILYYLQNEYKSIYNKKWNKQVITTKHIYKKTYHYPPPPVMRIHYHYYHYSDNVS